MRVRWGRTVSALLVWGLPWLAACQSPGSQPIIGPDGSPMAHVHCGADQGVCFRLAGELCPQGYDLKPVLSGNDGNFLVRCRAHAAPTVAACPAPSPAPTAASSPTVKMHPPGLMDPWPPANEPAPAAYPWAAPQTSATRNKPGASGDVDIGY